ncbi:RHS repeat-associated protein [Paenibacillus harenae]|uniref:RHS repeat-associated protein n=2 Tax=Paenibacillus harenae TaxID=306543 RepID=A0ABT9U306_PAEHA|nr:RHS repeat-associated protein [Paenibacillus harenae]
MTDADGLVYMRARYYHVQLKRFLNRDVRRGDLTDGQTFNRYAYVNGDPVNYIDPLGLCKDWIEKWKYPIGGKVIDGATFEGSLYRSVGEGHDPLLIHQGNINTRHRYTDEGIGGLYFSTGRKIVDAELAHWDVSEYGRVTHTFDTRIENLLDVSNPAVRSNLNISLNDMLGDSYEVTNWIGKHAKENGYNGIVAPSAKADGGLNVILFDKSSLLSIK